MQELLEWLRDWISEVVDWFRNIYKKILGCIKSIWASVKDGVKKLLDKGKQVFFVKGSAGKAGENIVKILNEGAKEVNINTLDSKYQEVDVDEFGNIERVTDIDADPIMEDTLDRLLSKAEGLVKLTH